MANLVYSADLTQVTVAAGKLLSRYENGFLTQYVAGDTLWVPTNEVARLQRDKVIN